MIEKHKRSQAKEPRVPVKHAKAQLQELHRIKIKLRNCSEKGGELFTRWLAGGTGCLGGEATGGEPSFSPPAGVFVSCPLRSSGLLSPPCVRPPPLFPLCRAVLCARVLCGEGVGAGACQSFVLLRSRHRALVVASPGDLRSAQLSLSPARDWR